MSRAIANSRLGRRLGRAPGACALAGIWVAAFGLAGRGAGADVYALIATVENYPKQVLAGCSLDGQRIYDYLTKVRKTPESHIIRLKDSQATSKAIVAGLKTISQQAKGNDWLVFYYSGHGFYIPDANGDEGDGYDEVLTPYDVKVEPGNYQIDGQQAATADGAGHPLRLVEGYVVDDEIGQWADEAVGRGLKVAIISDSCHSGTVSRGELAPAAANVGANGACVRQFCLPEAEYESLLSAQGEGRTRGASARSVLDTVPPMQRPKGIEGIVDRSAAADQAGCVGLFACRATQRSWGDAREGGAFTSALAKCLAEKAAPTLADLSAWAQEVKLRAPAPQNPLMELPAGMRGMVFLGESTAGPQPTPGATAAPAPSAASTPVSAPPPGAASVDIEWVQINPGGGAASFEISATEISNRQFRAFLEANPQWRKEAVPQARQDGDYLKNWNGMECPTGTEGHPVTYVSFYAAQAFCEWIGARLPHETEWERAALGPEGGQARAIGVVAMAQTQAQDASTGRAREGILYPWRGPWDPNRCNSAEGPTPLGRAFPVRSIEAGAVDWGGRRIYHLSGNAAEWCDELYAEGRPIKGGSFMANRLGCAIGGVVIADPRLCAPDVGFRAAK